MKHPSATDAKAEYEAEQVACPRVLDTTYRTDAPFLEFFARIFRNATNDFSHVLLARHAESFTQHVFMKIQIASSESEKKAAFELRYAVYVGELGRQQGHADHKNRLVIEPIDRYSTIFVAMENGQCVGTLRLTFGRNGPLECQDLYGLEEFSSYFPNKISMTTKLVVSESYRKSTVAGRLSIAAYKHAREHGIAFDFIDTNPHLVRLYQQMGYRFYRSNVLHEEYGTVIPMVLLINDVQHLELVGSPFRKLAKRGHGESESKSFFEMAFPRYAKILPTFCEDDEALLQEYSSIIHFDCHEHLSIFRGFSIEEIIQILKCGHVVSYKQGNGVMRRGDHCQGLFAILDGQVEVVGHTPGSVQLVDILSPGDVFGELGYFEQSIAQETILVREDARILVIDPSAMTKLESIAPSLAIRLLKNLVRVLGARLCRVQASLS